MVGLGVCGERRDVWLLGRRWVGGGGWDAYLWVLGVERHRGVGGRRRRRRLGERRRRRRRVGGWTGRPTHRRRPWAGRTCFGVGGFGGCVVYGWVWVCWCARGGWVGEWKKASRGWREEVSPPSHTKKGGARKTCPSSFVSTVLLQGQGVSRGQVVGKWAEWVGTKRRKRAGVCDRQCVARSRTSSRPRRNFRLVVLCTTAARAQRGKGNDAHNLLPFPLLKPNPPPQPHPPGQPPKALHGPTAAAANAPGAPPTAPPPPPAAVPTTHFDDAPDPHHHLFRRPSFSSSTGWAPALLRRQDAHRRYASLPPTHPFQPTHLPTPFPILSSSLAPRDGQAPAAHGVQGGGGPPVPPGHCGPLPRQGRAASRRGVLRGRAAFLVRSGWYEEVDGFDGSFPPSSLSHEPPTHPTHAQPRAAPPSTLPRWKPCASSSSLPTTPFRLTSPSSSTLPAASLATRLFLLLPCVLFHLFPHAPRPLFLPRRRRPCPFLLRFLLLRGRRGGRGRVDEYGGASSRIRRAR